MDLNSTQANNVRNKNTSSYFGATSSSSSSASSSGISGFPRKQWHLKSMGGGIMYPRTMYS